MIAEFEKLFGSAQRVRVFRAPGRVNLIGEHTDYNLGFVMPVALDLATYVATAPAPGGKLSVYSEHTREMRRFDARTVGSLEPRKHWTDYVVGVAQQLARAGYEIAPANLLIRSTVPEGSGLSSSAALEVSSALAMLNGLHLDRLELAKLCQRAEREFVGMPCGIMDQYVSVFGREHSAVEIDCRRLTHRYATMPEGASIVAVNSMVKHALGGSAYQDRVAECAAAVEAVRQRFPAVKSLRDATLEQLDASADLLSAVPGKRARHVVTEDNRVERFAEASAAGDLSLMGRFLVESHRSLQYDYEVSCEELDFLVDRALEVEGVYGSRMTGGGFGGCTVTMLRSDAVPAFRDAIGGEYRKRYGITPQVYVCNASAGAGEVDNLEMIPAA